MCTWLKLRSISSLMPASLRSTRPSRTMELMVSVTTRGCSWISLIMKCSKPARSADSASQVICTGCFSMGSWSTVQKRTVPLPSRAISMLSM